MGMISKSKVIPIRITIFTAFSIALILIGSVIIGMNYWRNRQSSLETADMILEKDSQQVFMKIANLYEPLLNITNQSSELPILGEKPTLQNHPAESYLLNSMDAYPQIQILYMGFEDGDFYEILSCKGELHNTLRETINAPEGTEFAILRQFRVEGEDEPVRLWRFLNSVRQTIGSRKEAYTGYDPRMRPWYINAKESFDSVKTDPYFFPNVKQMGLTISRQIDGEVPGVLGADILMYEMTSFLDKMKKSDEDYIFIFNSNLYITASQKELIAYDHQIHIKELDLPLLNGFNSYVELYGLGDDMDMQLDVDGERYLVKVKKLPDRYSNNEYLFLALPMKVLLGPINRDAWITSLISIILMFLSLPLFLYISQRISNPINQLVDEAGKIGQFKLEGEIEIKTRIKETKRLSDEMASMKRGLRLFNRYVPSELVRSIMISGSNANIGGEAKEMTFMFTDIEGFTSITEQTEPEVLMHRLSEYLELVSSVIKKYRGTVDKFIGDSVMAFWNAPLDDNRHIENCCYAAIEIQKELGELNDYWASIGVPVFKTRIGIDTGVAVVGNLGCRDRMNYTVIGDSVNSSSRLEGLNRFYGSSIIIGERVAKVLDDSFIFRPLEKIVVKGKTQAQNIYQLLGEQCETSIDSREFADLFTKAFYAYQSRDWKTAYYLFNTILIMREDRISREYMDNCREYMDCEPDMEWSGIKVMEKK